MSPTQFSPKATANETVELATALLSFVLVMIGVNERIKAGADLLKAMAKVCSARMDLPLPANNANPPAAATERVGATSEPPPLELNLRKVLDALAILTIEMNTEGLLAVLHGRKIVDGNTAICRADSPYAADPAAWTEVGWVQTFLAGSSLAELDKGNRAMLRLNMPNATTGASGELGALLESEAPVSAGRETSVGPMPCVFAIIGAKRIPKRRLRIAIQSVRDLRTDLTSRGIRLKGRKPVQGYIVLLNDSADNSELFSVVIISTLKVSHAS